MEYLRVTFDPTDIRDVIANGNIIGKTEDLLMLPTNFYHLRLIGSGLQTAGAKSQCQWNDTRASDCYRFYARTGAAVIGASDV